jgi:hypothetical protein
MGKVALRLGLDAEGNVENLEATTENPRLLKESAVEISNIGLSQNRRSL